jgi:hypothetical protein
LVLLDKARVAQVVVDGTIQLGNRGDALILVDGSGRSIGQAGAAAMTVALTAFGSPPGSARLARIGGESCFSATARHVHSTFWRWRESNVTTVTAS